MPQLQHICQRLTDCHNNADLAATLLSAAPLIQPAAFDINPYVDSLIRRTQFSQLHVWVVRRLFRSKSNRSSEELELLFRDIAAKAEPFCTAGNVRVNAQVGHLRATYATYLCRYDSPDRAERLLCSWMPCNQTKPSELEQTIRDRMRLAQATILRYRGENSKARLELEALRDSSIRESAFRAELYQNLFELSANPIYIDRLPLDILPTGYKDVQSSLSRADENFREDALDHALKEYKSVAERYCTDTQLVRAKIGVAKTQHRQGHEATVESWRAVKRLIVQLGWRKGFALGLVDLSLAVLLNDPGEIDVAIAALGKTEGIWLVGGADWVTWLCQGAREMINDQSHP